MVLPSPESCVLKLNYLTSMSSAAGRLFLSGGAVVLLLVLISASTATAAIPEGYMNLGRIDFELMMDACQVGFEVYEMLRDRSRTSGGPTLRGLRYVRALAAGLQLVDGSVDDSNFRYYAEFRCSYFIRGMGWLPTVIVRVTFIIEKYQTIERGYVDNTSMQLEGVDFNAIDHGL
ncbi:hypothetical protein AXF42_Ash014416 [Apostasia shenzhenica]|uniref:Uncharacterized protein n=1 Tax=Apostasia shenzhenica TaxID=1088818 RepID=A0A2I0B144_9ASPA|nr:hypothetical protein AXF42_Ash014416 [Apostasia shenzhenica]